VAWGAAGGVGHPRHALRLQCCLQGLKAALMDVKPGSSTKTAVIDSLPSSCAESVRCALKDATQASASASVVLRMGTTGQSCVVPEHQMAWHDQKEGCHQLCSTPCAPTCSERTEIDMLQEQLGKAQQQVKVLTSFQWRCDWSLRARCGCLQAMEK
jgi:hypothetical protein